jgi:hypothetical protein
MQVLGIHMRKFRFRTRKQIKHSCMCVHTVGVLANNWGGYRTYLNDINRLNEGVAGSGLGLFLIVGHWPNCIRVLCRYSFPPCF